MSINKTSNNQAKVSNLKSTVSHREYASVVAEQYAKERKEKAGKQGAKFSQEDWDQMKNSKYALF